MARGRWRFAGVIEAVTVAIAAAAAAGAGGCGGGGSSSTDGGGPGGKLNQRPTPAVPLFDAGRLHEVSLMMTPEDWQSILDDSRGDEWRHATATYDGVVLEDVGVRPAGESSRFAGNPKMSIRIKFDAFSGQGKFGGYQDVNVKGEYDDGSMMRERLALFVFAAVMPAPQAAHTTLTVNGDSRGLFTLREDWDSTSLAEHFSAPLGPLYRIRPEVHSMDPYAYVGDDPTSYVPVPWERHLKDTPRGDEVVPPFLKSLPDYSTLENYVDVNDLLAYLAVAAILMTTDGLVGSSGASDHYQYFDPQSGKFFVLPWDPDNTFGSQDEMPTKPLSSKLGRNALTIVVRDRPDLHDAYRAKIAETMGTIPLATVQAQADMIYNQIKDAAHADTVKMFPNDAFDWSLTDVKDFAAARYANLQEQLAN
jgi:spore coat protein CotH